MGNIAIAAYRYVYKDGNKEKVIIDCKDCIKNKSRIPLTSGSEKQTDILKLVRQISADCRKLSDGRTDPDSCMDILMDLLAARVLMKTAMPLHIVQIGSMDGILSYHLAVLAGKYHPDTSLCCVCNAVGNESGNYWLDWISQVDCPPRLSMLAADYDDTQLQSGHFDLVVVNGAEYFDNPYSVLREAGRLVKRDGAVLCYVSHQPLLSDCFRMIFEEYEEYGEEDSANGTKVFQAISKGQVWTGESGALTETEVNNWLNQVHDVLKQNPDRKTLRAYMADTDACIAKSMRQKRVDLKVRLMELKGRILEKMYPADHYFPDF